VVAEGQLVGGAAERGGEDLVTETDPEDGLERNTPSGSRARTSPAVVPAGTTVTVPRVVSNCTMVVFTPKSYATTRRPVSGAARPATPL